MEIHSWQPAPVHTHLIEPSQEDGADHTRDVKSNTGQEPGTLQSNIGCPNDEGLPRGRGHGEQVVTGDAILAGTWDVRVTRSSTWAG